MLGCDELRAIKPIGSVDECEAVVVEGESNAQKSERFIKSILELLKEKPFASVNEMVDATDISEGSIHTITTRMFKAGLVVRERRKIEGIVKPSWFYSLPE